MGSELNGQFERVAQEKAELSVELEDTLQQLTRDWEEIERLAIAADLWRSKFVASCVLVEELTPVAVGPRAAAESRRGSAAGSSDSTCGAGQGSEGSAGGPWPCARLFCCLAAARGLSQRFVQGCMCGLLYWSPLLYLVRRVQGSKVDCHFSGAH